MMTNNIDRSKNIMVYFLAFVIFCNNLMWMFSLPYNQASDEGDHYKLCRFVSVHNRLPIFNVDKGFEPYWMNFFTKLPTNDREIKFYSQLPRKSLPEIVYQPRFFPEILDPSVSYMISALFMKIAGFFTDDTYVFLYASRIISVIAGTLVSLLTFFIAQRIFPKEKYLPWLSMFFVGFLPQFTSISSYLNQDAMTALICTAVFLMWLKCLDDWSKKNITCLGGLFGLIVLSKINAYILIVLTGIFMLMFLRKGLKENSRIIISIAFYAAVVSAWFFIWNFITYKNPWPRYLIATQLNEMILSTPKEIIGYTAHHNLEIGNWSSWASFFNFNFWSFWGLFGWMNNPMLPQFYQIARILTVVPIVGFVIYSYVNFDSYFSKEKKVFLLMLSVFPILFLMSVLYSATKEFSPQGRYFFPTLTPLAISFAIGWLSLSKAEVYKRKIFITVSALLVMLNVGSFLINLVGLYYLPAF